MPRNPIYRHFLTISVSVTMLSLAACSGHSQRSAAQDVVYEGNEDSIVDTSVTEVTVNDIDATNQSATVAKKQDNETAEFDVAMVTDDSTLSEMRGGFVSTGGLLINFGLVSSTSINNQLVSSFTLSTKNLNGVLPGTLQQLLQTGTGNQASVAPSAVPVNVLTVVQNSANNQVIQSQNVLDITVGNLAAFRTQQIAFNQRFAAGLSR